MSGMGPDYPGMGQDAPPGFIGQQQQANDQQLVSQRPGSPSEFMGSQGKYNMNTYSHFFFFFAYCTIYTFFRPSQLRLDDYLIWPLLTRILCLRKLLLYSNKNVWNIIENR